MENTNPMVSDSVKRDEFFSENWADALAMFMGLSMNMPKGGWAVDDQKRIVEGMGMLLTIINDMRKVDLNQRAEITSLKALLNMKEVK